MLKWFTWGTSDLTVKSLHDILALRVKIFVVEQECPYQEIDGRDLEKETRHIAGYKDGELVAYCRILVNKEDAKEVSRIGRVVVHDKHRGGLGSELLRRAIEFSCSTWPDRDVVLSAQEHLQGFYGKFGFVPVGEVYLEDNIPHIEMILQTKPAE